MLLLETADVIERTLIVEWSDLQERKKLGLRQYLMSYVLSSLVRDKIRQVIGILIKRNAEDSRLFHSEGDYARDHLHC